VYFLHLWKNVSSLPEIKRTLGYFDSSQNKAACVYFNRGTSQCHSWYGLCYEMHVAAGWIMAEQVQLRGWYPCALKSEMIVMELLD
jgi:hypothetical protein